MDKNNVSNYWDKDNIRWNVLSQSYSVNDFYIKYVGEDAAGCIALTDKDSKYWCNDKDGESIYVHKLAVKDRYRGMGISSAMMNLAKELAIKAKCKSLKLDCNAERTKLRKLYERQGFILVDIVTMQDGHKMALYCMKL